MARFFNEASPVPVGNDNVRPSLTRSSKYNGQNQQAAGVTLTAEGRSLYGAAGWGSIDAAADVAVLQKYIRELGVPITIDGAYGPETRTKHLAALAAAPPLSSHPVVAFLDVIDIGPEGGVYRNLPGPNGGGGGGGGGGVPNFEPRPNPGPRPGPSAKGGAGGLLIGLGVVAALGLGAWALTS